MSSISNGERPLLDPNNVPTEDVEQVLGGITSLLQIVSQISILQSLKKSAREAGTCNVGDQIVPVVMTMSSSLEAQLQDWSISTEEPEWFNTAEAYRHAAFIYLYRVVYNIGAPHPLTMRHVRSCLDALEAVPSTSSLASVHVWPLWTAGCESIDWCDREFCRQRLQAMYDERKLPSLLRAQAAMGNVWTQKDREAQRGTEEASKVDCIAVLKEQGTAVDLG
jgi:hypothetical protein